MDISGKTAIVTGAASGIGLGIATALAEAGANVVMADIQKDAVEQAAHAQQQAKQCGECQALEHPSRPQNRMGPIRYQMPVDMTCQPKGPVFPELV